ncbi:MAG: hypothetical protein OEW34_14005 [Burkholderiaceae bacterium]|nr:hypothetical protein [Burkholderiaceae bacterium]
MGLVVVLAASLIGCGIIQRLTGEDARKQARIEEAKERNKVLQLKVMRFADQYVERVTRRADQLVADFGEQLKTVHEIDDLQARIAREEFSQATAAFQIAAGTNPVANVVDMVTLVSMTRRIVEYNWVPQYGEAAASLLRTYKSLETQAWRLADDFATEEQKAKFDQELQTWYEANPRLESAAYIRFTDVAEMSLGKREKGVSAGLLGIVGLDPMAGVDPAIREVEQSRILAERALYYAQRTPVLIDLQLRQTLARAEGSDYARETLETIDQVGRLSDSLALLAADLPGTVAREREAAVAQIINGLQSQQREMLALTQELRGALDAGAITAQSLDGLVNSTDRLMARFEPDPDVPGSAEPSRPFDINEYTRTINELASTARELQTLVRDVDALAPDVLDRFDPLAERAEALVDYAFWRLVLLVLVLVLALLAAAVMYRLIASRIGRSASPG